MMQQRRHQLQIDAIKRIIVGFYTLALVNLSQKQIRQLLSCSSREVVNALCSTDDNYDYNNLA